MSSFMMDHANAFAGRKATMIRASDSHANRGMNKIANAFLDSDCDIWINIDADIRFRRMDIDNLLAHAERGVPLVYGIYPKKEDASSPCLCTFAEVPVADKNELAKVRRCGRGFMLVAREVLEAMKEDNGGPALRYHNHGSDASGPKIEWDFFPSGCVTGEFSALDDGMDKDGFPIREWISEDWYFCERARQLGYSTLVDQSIALGHVGSKDYRFSMDTQVTRTDGWHGIHGWFTDADAEVYRIIAEAIPENGIVAEVGTWLGRSLGAFMQFCEEKGKTPKIHAIDTFKGTLSEGEAHAGIVAAHGGSIRSAFEKNIAQFTLSKNVIVHEADSVVVAQALADARLDAVFIDGDHTFDAVTRDVAAWWPKVKKGGIIAGHDYDYPEVAAAVYMLLGRNGYKIETVGRCWIVRI
jgi:hypothetical protein